MRKSGLDRILRRAGMPTAVAAALLFVSACGGGGSPGQVVGPTSGAGSPAAPAVVLALTGTEYSFTPTALKASVGPTTIRFTNKGAMEHDFTIKSLGVHLVAKPGKSAEATVTLASGTYKTTCSVAGHSQSGMQGTLAVS